MKLINIGFGNLVSSDKIVAVVAPDSAPVKRIVQDAKQNNLLIEKRTDESEENKDEH